MLRIAAEKKLLSGKSVGVDSTLLEANAAMKSIVRRDTGEDWKQFVTRLMREEERSKMITSRPTKRFAASINSGRTSACPTTNGFRPAIRKAASRR